MNAEAEPIESGEPPALPPLSEPGRRRWTQIVVPLIIVLIAGAAVGVVALLPPRKSTSQAISPSPVNVVVEQVKVIPTMPDTFELDGGVEPNWVVKVAAEVPGRVERYANFIDADGKDTGRALKDGDPIRKGAGLMVLNTDLLAAEYNRIKAGCEFDQREFDRVKQAERGSVATQTELDLAATKLAVSKADLAAVKARLDRATIISPVSGVLNDLLVEVGEYVKDGRAVAEITDTDTVKVVVNVPEKDIGYLRVGQEQCVFDRLRGDLEGFDGRISYISELAEPLARTTRVEIEVPNKDRRLRDGQIVSVRLKRRDLTHAIMIPLDAVIPRESGHMVYLLVDGKAQPRKVKIDIDCIRGKRILVTGLSGGELLIVEGNWQVGPGQAVREVARVTAPPVRQGGRATTRPAPPTGGALGAVVEGPAN